MMDEKNVIQNILNGNSIEFQLIIDHYQQLVGHIVFRMVDRVEDREDICQDIFVSVFKNLNKFKFESKFSTWIARIAYNRCINFLEKMKVPLYDDITIEDQVIDDYKSHDKLPDEFVEMTDISSRLQFELGNIPVRLRTILTLYHLHEMSYKEIGDIMNMPQGTIKSYLFRARKILKERLTSKYQQEELW